MGGPMSEAMPWNNNRIPKAFVNLSSPNRSTRITEVRPTYAPIVEPKTIVYKENVKKSVQYVLKIVAAWKQNSNIKDYINTIGIRVGTNETRYMVPD